MNKSKEFEAMINLFQGPHWNLNKKLVKVLGLKAAVWIADIWSKWQYFKEKEMLDADGFFFNTQKKIAEDTTLSPGDQNKVIKQLIGLGIIKVKKKGLPARNFYCFDFNKFLDFYSTSNPKNSEHNYNKNKTNKNKERLSSKEDNTGRQGRPERSTRKKLAATIPAKKPSRKAYTLLKHWNKSKIVVHRAGTKTHAEALLAAERVIKKHGYKAVCRAIDNYRIVLESSPFYSKKYSMVTFLDPPKKFPKVQRLLRKCLDGSALTEETYMGKKSKKNVVKKEVIDPHPKLTAVVAEAFYRNISSDNGHLPDKQTKDYVHFMDGADVIRAVKRVEGDEIPDNRLAKMAVGSLVKFMKQQKLEGKRFCSDGAMWPAYFSAPYFVSSVILENFCGYYGYNSGEIGQWKVVPGKFKRKYLSK